jgi:hypothetical protein
MPRSLFVSAIATCLYIALTGPLLASPTANADARATPATGLALDTTKSVLEAAPRVSKNSFTVGASADNDSQKADAYWKANQPAKTSP